MTSPSMRLWRRLSSVRGNDRGATLMYALIFTTVLAVILASILALADTNLRSTQAVRKQAALAAAADGAAKVAINKLRLGTFSGATGSDCWGGTPMTVPYTDPDGVSHTLNVQCTADPETTIGRIDSTWFGAALVALSKTGTALDLNISGGGSMKIAGNVYSAGTLHIQNNDELDILPALNGSVPAVLRSNVCDLGNKAKLVLNSTALTVDSTAKPPKPAQCFVSPAGADDKDPQYTRPAMPAAKTLPSCSAAVGNVLTIQPGYYKDAGAVNVANTLTTLMGCAKVIDFRPGVYYFDTNGTWSITPNVTVVGGSPTPLTSSATVPSDPLAAGLCADPLTTPVAGAGVQFVFGPNARLSVGGNGTSPTVELCGRTFDKNAPVVIYGDGTTGNVFSTQNKNATIHIKGVIYAPKAGVNVAPGMGSSTLNVYFMGGIVANNFFMGSPNSTTFTTPVISIPTSGTTYTSRLVAVIEVSLDGKSLLKSKVGFTDPTGTPQAGNRGVTVYSWSVQR